MNGEGFAYFHWHAFEYPRVRWCKNLSCLANWHEMQASK